MSGQRNEGQEEKEKKLQYPPCKPSVGMVYYAAFEGHKACSEPNKDKDNKDEKQWKSKLG